MKSIAREIGFAFLAWLLPFVSAVSMSPLKRSYEPLFESLMGSVLVGSTVLLAYFYLRRRAGRASLGLGIRVGLVWAAASWLLDGLMFFEGPMRMTLRQYAMEIGAAYMMIPIITTGLAAAFAASQARPRFEGRDQRAVG